MSQQPDYQAFLAKFIIREFLYQVRRRGENTEPADLEHGILLLLSPTFFVADVVVTEDFSCAEAHVIVPATGRELFVTAWAKDVEPPQ